MMITGVVWYTGGFHWVRGETISGTRVTSGKTNGTVVKAEIVDGYNEFTIQWSMGKKDSKYCLDDVLRDRDDGQAVVSLEDATEKMNIVLLAALCMVNIHVHKIIVSDLKVDFPKDTCPLCPLTARELENTPKSREYAWTGIKKARAVGMLNPDVSTPVSIPVSNNFLGLNVREAQTETGDVSTPAGIPVPNNNGFKQSGERKRSSGSSSTAKAK